MKNQRGFTLIELVVVIIILGILAAVAVPKFVDMSVQAHNAAAKGVAGALSSGSSINYAARAANVASAVTLGTTSTCAAGTLSGLLTGAGVTLVTGTPAADDQFKTAASGSDDCTSTAVASVTCLVTPNGAGAQAASAVILCAR